MQQANQTGTCIIATKSIEFSITLQTGNKWIFVPTADRLYCVNMGIKEPGGLIQIKSRTKAPYIIALTTDLHSLCFEISLQVISRLLLFTTDRGYADELLE